MEGKYNYDYLRLESIIRYNNALYNINYRVKIIKKIM